jgi:5-hydroxyisourate hydrolase
MGQLTTHVLDVAHGVPAQGIIGQLCNDTGETLASFTTNGDGRCPAPLLQGPAFQPGRYRLTFWTAAYFAGRGIALPEPPFFDDIHIHFGVADASGHYHVPLLLSPWSFSTYRGS